MSPRFFAPALALALLAPSTRAELAPVRGVELRRGAYGEWSARVQIEHEDTGWSHFVDRWELLDQDGRRIVFRHLHEPKIKDVEEGGPVVRRHRAFPIPDGVVKVTVRAHCKRSGWGGEAFEVDLASRVGPGYSIGAAAPGLLPSFEGVERFLIPRLRKHVDPPRRWPYPPRSPVPPVPADPVDSRPRLRREYR